MSFESPVNIAVSGRIELVQDVKEMTITVRTWGNIDWFVPVAARRVARGA
jgi:hypothetical protein